VNRVLGVELTEANIRAVCLEGWRTRTVRTADVRWDPSDPASGISALFNEFGRGTRVAVAIDLSLLFVKRLKLPPVPASEKRRIVSLEPDRFFPVRGGEELTVVVRDHDTLTFAANEEQLTAWLVALEILGPLDYVEPAPIALTRALSAAGIRDAKVLIDRGKSGCVSVDIVQGALHDARRVQGMVLQLISSLSESEHEGKTVPPIYLEPWDPQLSADLMRQHESLEVRALPSLAGVDPPSLVAYGAALGAESPLKDALVPRASAQRMQARRNRPRFVAAAACLAALGFALWSADYARARTERGLDAQLQALADRSSGTLALQAEQQRMTREEGVLARAERDRPEQLSTLLAVTQRLPADAHVVMLRAVGANWQLDGVAGNSARLIPVLEEHERLDSVRFLEATRRVEGGGRIRENFSLTLHAVRAP
jgi:hypothetical protein